VVTVTNPTQFTESISIQVQASGLIYEAPENVLLGPFNETTFDLNITGSEAAYS